MEAKPKIAIVAGELQQPRFLALFEALRQTFDVCVYALHEPNAVTRLLDRHGTGLRIRLFEAVADMPGYMRGLEEELAGAALIIGLETSRLATFQAVRAARKFGVPMCAVASEFRPYFYERYANIRAIQADIVNKSEHFWATSEAAAQVLAIDGVAPEAISRLRPVVDVQRFRPLPGGRQKFREYVGLGEAERVILFQCELESWNRPELALETLALLLRRVTGVRLLFAGTGGATMDLKYRSFDMGLGKHVLFLHQDPEPFLVDLYNACDVLLQPRPLKTDFPEDLPLRVLEGMACGLVPLVGAGSIGAELAGGAGLVYPDDSHQALAAALQPVLLDARRLEEARQRAIAHVQALHTVASVGPRFVEEVHAVLASLHTRAAAALDVKAVVQAAEAETERGGEREALVRIEEALLLDVPTPSDRAELLRVKGDAHYGLGAIDEAMEAYSEALKLDDRNVKCLRGLGFVSWQGHANEEALTFFKKAVALAGDDAQTLFGIGLVYRRLGLSEEALYWLERCAVGFALPSAIVALAQTCAQLSQQRLGIDVLLRVIDAVGENHTLMVTLGQLYLATGKVAEGHAILQKALASDTPAA